MTKPLLTIASGNPKKVTEIESMLGPLPIDFQRQPAGLEVEETGSTYLENALLKASAAAKLTGTYALADDSGLEVDVLDGAPGIYSARYGNTNEDKLRKLLNAIGETPYRSARFRSAIVLCDAQGNLLEEAEGVCWGELLRSPAYPGGEFESLLWVREANCTYGELTYSQLSRLGSRGKAARELGPALKQRLGI